MNNVIEIIMTTNNILIMNPILTNITHTYVQNPNNYSFIFSCFALLISIISIFLTWYISVKNMKQKIIYELIDQYQSREMLECLTSIRNYFSTLMIKYKFRNKKLKNENDIYFQLIIDLMKDERSIDQKLNYSRRIVSHFYQKVVIYEKKKYISSKEIMEIWNPNDLSILGQVIIPFEKLYYKSQTGYETNNTIESLQAFFNKYGEPFMKPTISSVAPDYTIKK